MLPFLCLFILCGLLTQNAQGNVYPAAVANFSPEMLHRLISQRMNTQEWEDHLQKLPLEEAVKNGMRKGSSGGGLLSGLPLIGGVVDNVVGGIIGLKIKKVSLLKLDLKLDPHETKIIVTIPADIELEVNCPLGLMKRLVHLKLYLDIQVGVRLVKDPYTGRIKLTIENCQNNPGHLRITLLDNVNPLFQLLNKVLRLVTDILEKTVPHILQKELCPLANGLIQSVLDLLQGTLISEMHGEKFQLLPESFQIHDDTLHLAYGGMVQMPGGQSVMISPDSSSHLSIPLEEGSPMNVVLSDKYLESAMRALMPSQIYNLASQNEVAVLPEVSNIRTLQIQTGAASLTLAVGKIQLLQLIEIRFYTGHPSTYGPLFTIRFKLVTPVHPSISGGKMVFTLHNPRIENQQSSSFGNLDAQRQTGIVSRVVTTYLLPHQNKQLAEGIPIPLVHNLGFNSVHIAAGEDALLVFVPSNEVLESA